MYFSYAIIPCVVHCLVSCGGGARIGISARLNFAIVISSSRGGGTPPHYIHSCCADQVQTQLFLTAAFFFIFAVFRIRCIQKDWDALFFLGGYIVDVLWMHLGDSVLHEWCGRVL